MQNMEEGTDSCIITPLCKTQKRHFHNAKFIKNQHQFSVPSLTQHLYLCLILFYKNLLVCNPHRGTLGLKEVLKTCLKSRFSFIMNITFLNVSWI